MALEDRHRPIELLGEHHADQQMWPRHRAQRQDERCPVQGRAAEPVGASDEERDLAPAGVAPTTEPGGEVTTGERHTAFVERDDERVRRRPLQQRGGCRVGVTALTDDDLDDLQPPRKTPAVPFNQRVDRWVPGPPDRDDGEARRAADAQPASAAARAGGATDQSRSRS